MWFHCDESDLWNMLFSRFVFEELNGSQAFPIFDLHVHTPSQINSEVTTGSHYANNTNKPMLCSPLYQKNTIACKTCTAVYLCNAVIEFLPKPVTIAHAHAQVAPLVRLYCTQKCYIYHYYIYDKLTCTCRTV